jgi:type I restriction enzyme M protein
VVVSYDDIKAKNYSFSAGQYFDVKIEYTDISPAEFEAKMTGFKTNLDKLFAESGNLEIEIKKQLAGLSLND